jgi:hypothetical protein
MARMGGSMIEDEGHRVDLPAQRFGNDLLMHKRLEIDKAFARAARPVDLAISHGKGGKQMACSTPMVPRFAEHELARPCWARRLFSLACLDRGFLIQTDQPSACS